MSQVVDWIRRERQQRKSCDELCALSSEQVRARMQKRPDEKIWPLLLLTALSKEGKQEELLAESSAQIERWGPSQSFFALPIRAHLLRKLGRDEEALADYETTAAHGFGGASTHLAIGDLYRRFGDLPAARRAWYTAARFNKQPPSPLWFRAWEQIPNYLARWRLLTA